MDEHQYHSFIYHLNRIDTSLKKIIGLLEPEKPEAEPKPDSIYESKADEELGKT